VNVLLLISGVPRFQGAAENIPFEPDPGNAGVGSGGIYSSIRAMSFAGERVWFFILDDP
jgi:hypothetical protein